MQLKNLFRASSNIFHINDLKRRIEQLETLKIRIERLELNVHSLNLQSQEVHPLLATQIPAMEQSIDPYQAELRNQLLQRILPTVDPHIHLNRYGRSKDGGYFLASPINKDDLLISAGLSDDISFEEQLAPKIKFIVGLDHTIARLSTSVPNFEHVQHGLKAEASSGHSTLTSLLAEYPARDYLLKIDIEGDEWKVLDATNAEDLQKFRQIVVEFHGFAQAISYTESTRMLRVLDKLNTNHSVAVLHPNNNGIFHYFGTYQVPDVIEVTYLRNGETYEVQENSIEIAEGLLEQNSQIRRPISLDWITSIQK